ncbi:MAG TPA: glucose-1-phosphate adenylyltransferase [Candidatus Omnitrophota bacterium]|nr:glucose-1-phosphate adenylyltransferase [Candidatus Omnitrophota bacterium]
MNEVLCVILGGGRGTRLYPLTKERCKPAVPLFGKHRLIDIPISNCLNAGLRKIYILTQFNSESLNKHINRTYKMEPFSGGFVEIMAAEQSMDNANWFQGTADAVRRCFKHFNNPSVKYILILSGDQLYKIDLWGIIRQHVEKKAQVTVACNRVPMEECHHFGIMSIDDNQRIKSFIEKPRETSQLKDMGVVENGKTSFLASMGIYVFDKYTLIELLNKSMDKVDFGKEIIPDAIKLKSTYAYVFDGYWRDIGNMKTFYHESLMLTESMPPLDMFDEKWPIFTRPRYLPPAKFENCSIEKSIIAEGTIIGAGSNIVRSVIALRLRIGDGTSIKETITMGSDYYETTEQMVEDVKAGIPYIGIGRQCHIERAIIDKNVRIGNNVRIVNVNKLEEFDGPNYFIRDGIVIISKNTIIPDGTVI